MDRTKYILDYAQGESAYSIAKKYGENHQKVEKIIKKAICYGALTSLSDLPGKGRRRIITEEARLWFLHIACTSPKELGLPRKVWTMSSLAKYVREHCVKEGTVHKLLAQSNPKPYMVPG